MAVAEIAFFTSMPLAKFGINVPGTIPLTIQAKVCFD